MPNNCLTYFGISGDVYIDEVCEALNIKNVKTRRKHNNRMDIIIGENREYDVDINNMIRITLDDLFEKANELVDLKNRYSLKYYLNIVPDLDVEDSTMIFALEPDIMRFLLRIDATYDIDLYITEGFEFKNIDRFIVNNMSTNNFIYLKELTEYFSIERLNAELPKLVDRGILEEVNNGVYRLLVDDLN